LKIDLKFEYETNFWSSRVQNIAIFGFNYLKTNAASVVFGLKDKLETIQPLYSPKVVVKNSF
jgi:hypothetical protein